jgi:hypothetical protein
MDESMRNVPRNMRKMGMLLFRDAFAEAAYGENLLCVVHMAHAAEILLKARIAQEDPLSIFYNILALSKKGKNTLKFIDLIENGHTYGYAQLPEELEKKTGIKIERQEQYKEFGKIRNQIVHLSISNTEQALDELTLLYALELLDPLVEKFWGRSVFDFIKNDYFCELNSFISMGFFEEKIKKIHPIDERLRRLLGESSKESLERIEIPSGICFSELEEYNPNEIPNEFYESSLNKSEKYNPPENPDELKENYWKDIEKS